MRVVLLHGFTQGPGSWDAVVERLVGRAEFVALTLPGHAGGPGVSPETAGGPGVSPETAGGPGVVEGSFEEAAGRLAEAGGAGVWVGYSMGGRLALRMALDHPDLVDGLVLVGASPGLADPAERTARRVADETLAAGLERKGVEHFLAGWLRLPLFERLPREAAGLEERRKNTAEGLASALRRLGTGAQEPLWERLGELRMPVLLMAGEHDTTFVAVTFRMAAAIGNQAEVSIVPGAGHTAHLERPDAVATLLERFLERRHQTARG